MLELCTETEARMFREAENAYVKRISRMTKAALAAEYCGDMTDRGMISVYGGPQSKDELIRALCELHYPTERLNMGTHVLYHQPGESWSACEWCRCQETRIVDGFIEQCSGGPGHDGDHSYA